MFHSYTPRPSTAHSSSVSDLASEDFIKNYAHILEICKARRDLNLKLMQFLHDPKNERTQEIHAFLFFVLGINAKQLSSALIEEAKKRMKDDARFYCEILKQLQAKPLTQHAVDLAYRDLIAHAEQYKQLKTIERNAGKKLPVGFLEEDFLNEIIQKLSPYVSQTMHSFIQNSTHRVIEEQHFWQLNNAMILQLNSDWAMLTKKNDELLRTLSDPTLGVLILEILKPHELTTQMDIFSKTVDFFFRPTAAQISQQTSEKYFEEYEKLLAFGEYLKDYNNRYNFCLTLFQTYTRPLLTAPEQPPVSKTPASQAAPVPQRPLIEPQPIPKIPTVEITVPESRASLLAQTQQKVEAYKRQLAAEKRARDLQKAHNKRACTATLEHLTDQPPLTLSAEQLKQCCVARLTLLNNNQLKLLAKLFSDDPSAKTNLKIKYPEIENLFQALGALIVSPGRGGSHRKITLPPLLTLGFPQPEIVGFTFKNHGNAHSEPMPRFALNLIRDTLSRAGITPENLKAFQALKSDVTEAKDRRYHP
jgi:hypothetical protein